MYKSVSSDIMNVGKFVVIALVGLVLMALRYLLRTPQPLKHVLAGEDRLYKWTHGYISYTLAGSTESPALVLFHSPAIAASSYEMRSIIEGLAQFYQVYTLDLLGFGRSDQPDIDYSAEIYVTLYEDFLKEVVKRPATLLASGLSCNYCVALARRQPAVCERLIFLSPLSLFEHVPSLKLLAPLARMAQLPLLGVALYSFLTAKGVLRAVIARQQGVDSTHISSTDLAYRFAVAHQIGAYHAPLALFAGKLALDVSQQIEGIQQPILLLWGVHALQNAQSLLSQYEVSAHTQVVLLRDAAIDVHEERPQAVIDAICEWQENGLSGNRRAEAAHRPVATVAVQQEQTAVDTKDTKKPADASASTTIDEDASTAGVEAYCVKCKQKWPIQDPKPLVTKNGRKALEGTCPVCGTRLFRFVAS